MSLAGRTLGSTPSPRFATVELSIKTSALASRAEFFLCAVSKLDSLLPPRVAVPGASRCSQLESQLGPRAYRGGIGHLYAASVTVGDAAMAGNLGHHRALFPGGDAAIHNSRDRSRRGIESIRIVSLQRRSGRAYCARSVGRTIVATNETNRFFNREGGSANRVAFSLAYSSLGRSRHGW
jgi:hypothetical protein